MQNRAERHLKLELFDQAAATFEEAINIVSSGCRLTSVDTEIPIERVQDCRCLLGEVLQNKAELLLKLWSEQSHGGSLVNTLLGHHTLYDEKKIFFDAHELFVAAARQYRATGTNSDSYGSMRVDCLVNLGNTYAEHGNLYSQMLEGKKSGDDVEQCRQLYADSLACYEAAILKEDDAATWNNCADMLISYAEFEAMTTGARARDVYDKALRGYSRACELSSTEKGDSLPNLLCDWGSGLLSFSDYMRTHENDISAALHALSEAEKRLHAAISFDRGSTAPHTALGDVYIAVSEIYFEQEQMEDAWSCTEKAMNDGYGMALKIQRSHTDALVGCAETLVQKAKIARAGHMEAGPLLKQAVSLYQQAFATGRFSGTLKEKGDALYNVACCLAGIGCEDASQEAFDILKQLMDKQMISKDDIMSDEDLHTIHPFFA